MLDNRRFLDNAGEMGQIIIDYDWSKTHIGDIEKWPHSLLVTLGNILHSNFPQFLFWGDDLLCFYNDAYRPSLGNDGKHPAVGKAGKSVWPEIWNDINPLIDQVMSTGKAVWFEDKLLPIFRNNALEDVYWTFSYSPAYGDEGNIAGVLVTCMETTKKVNTRMDMEELVSLRTRELESAHDSLLETNGYFQDIINSFKEPLQVLEPIIENGIIVDFRFKLTNLAYSAYANTTPDKLEGRKVGEVFPGYFETSSFINVAKAFDSGNADTWEIHYDQDGLDLYNEMSATKLGNEVIVHFTDFTKLKHLQLELLRKIDELERSNRNLEAFANAASHDLKEPIRKIQVFTSQVKDKLVQRITDSESALFLKIENATQRMAHLIEDLMQYSLVNNKPFKKEIVNLNLQLKQVLEDLELTIQQQKAVVQIQLLPEVHGYDRQLQQLFQNLIGNALKYARPDVAPEIHISSEHIETDGRKYNVIHVIDNGIGFDQKYSEQIFEMFTRLHGKNQYSGNGIGLSIVKKIVDNHQGRIEAESTNGKGATFRVFLPIE